MEIIQFMMPTEIGPIYIAASDKGLEGVFLSRPNYLLVRKLDASIKAHQFILQAVDQLQEYFKGERKSFDVALNFQGTDFQKEVWRALSKIPYGKTVSYKYIAARIRNPKAVRAVGTANGRNPFCIVVPCHRVIAADGSLGGYSGGLEIKRKLLKLENITIS